MKIYLFQLLNKGFMKEATRNSHKTWPSC